MFSFSGSSAGSRKYFLSRTVRADVIFIMGLSYKCGSEELTLMTVVVYMHVVYTSL